MGDKLPPAGSRPTYNGSGMKDSLSRALKQIVDTVAPGANPRRTKNRSDIPEDAAMSPADRQTTDRHNY